MEISVTGAVTPAPALIFDLDGTLIDSVPDLQAAINRMLVAEGCPEMDRQQVQSFVGNGAPVLVRRVMEARGMDQNRHVALTEQVVADYTLHSAELTRTYPNVMLTLNKLKSSGCRLGICTNKPHAATTSVLSALGLGHYFDVIIAGDSLPERKPHPAPLLAARDALGRQKCLYVGDSEVDAECAEAAGVPFVFFSAGYLRVPRDQIRFAVEFADFAALPGIVANFGL